MKPIKATWIGATVLMLGVFPAGAADLFSVTVDTGGATDSASSNDIQDLVDFIEFGNYQEINAAYTDTSIATSLYDFRGVAASVRYPTAGSTLVFEIPAIGVSETFAEATRALSEEALIDFLETNQNGLLTALLQELVKSSPVDPVAGNPNSLMSKMVAADFDGATTVGPGTSFKATTSGEGDEDAPNLIGLQARFGRFAAGNFDSNVVDLPFSYVIPLADPRYAVSIDAPMTVVTTEGAQSYAASLGVGVRLPVLDNWFVTPAVRFGGTGSLEVGGASLLYNGSVTSNYEFEVAGVDFSLGNGVSFIQTLPLSFNSFEADYDLTNFVFRNGLGASGETPFSIFNEPVTWEAAIVNTQFLGDALFVENATDLSVSFGTKASESGLAWDSLRIGLTYTFTDADFSGVRLNFGYQF